MDRRGETRGRAPRLGLPCAAALALAACGSSEVAFPPVVDPVTTVAPGTLRLAGLSDLLVALGPSEDFPLALRLFRQDGLDPDRLRDLGTIPAPPGGAADPAHSVNEEWIALAGGAGWVQRVGTGGPYGAPSILEVPGPALRAVALGGRLAVVSTGALRLYDVTAPESPSLLATFPLGVPVTAMAAAGGGLFVFTTTGYGFLDPRAGTYSELDSPKLKGVTSAQAYAGKLYVGGPSVFPGRFRIARLEPSAAPVLGVELENERIADPEAVPFRDFSFDPRTREFLLLAVPREAGSSPSPAELHRYRESDGALVLSSVVRLGTPPLPGGGLALPPARPSVLHAFGGRAYVVVGGATGGVAIYRLP